MAQITVTLTKGIITDLYAASGIDTAKTLFIQNRGNYAVDISENSDMDGAISINPKADPWQNIVPGSAYAESAENGVLSVSSDAFKPVTQQGEIMPIGLFRGIRALTIQNYVEANVKNGVQFYTHFAYPLASPIAAGASKYFLFQTGATQVQFKNRVIQSIGEELQHEIFVSPTVTDFGTVLTPGNYGGANAQATTVQIWKDATVSADGTPVDDEPEYYFGGTATSGRSSVSFSEGIERTLNLNTLYLVKLTNNGAQDARMQWYGTWYEGDADLPRPAGEIS